MIIALITGTLFRDPKPLISKSNKPFTVATVKASDATGSEFVKVFCWGDHAREALDGLKEGDAISVTGKLSGEIYTPPGGEPRVSLSINADQVLSLKKPAAPRKKETPPTTGRPKGSGMRRIGEGLRAPPLNDDLPF
jgi:single-stranded DNA-binding protein